MAVRTARRRTRRNPIRTTGSLVINPRRRRRTRTRRRRNALEIRTNRRRNTRRNALQIRGRTNRRRNTRRRRVGMIATNPRRRNRRRLSAAHRRAISRGLKRRGRRRNTRRNPVRRNRRRRAAPRATYRRRRNTRRNRRRNPVRRNGFAAGLRKIPLIGPILASAIGLAPQAIFGAITVEPTMMAARFLGRFVPWMPAPLFYMVAGLLVGALLKSKFIPLAPATKNKLAIAAAAAAGGVGYYKAGGIGGLLSMGQGETMSDEVGALELRGYSGPLGLLEVGNLAGFGNAYGEYGPAAVHRLGVR